MPGTVNTVAKNTKTRSLCSKQILKAGNKIIRNCKNCYGKSRVLR